MPNIPKEQNAIILGALLHDIGKLLHRGNGEFNGIHQDAGEKFLIKFKSQLKNENLYNFELLKILIKYHNSTKKKLAAENNYYKSQTEEGKKKIWKFIKLINAADGYSCKERYTKQEQDLRRGYGRQVTPLDSIFSQISLGSKNDKKIKSVDKYCRYRIRSIDPLYSFPDKFTALEKDEIPNHIEKFKKNIPDFSNIIRFEDVLNVWLNLLEEYTWCIPSTTWLEISDVSLYDHLRSSSAIAACLYKYQIENQGREREKFILIGGNFSGIQKYICRITNMGSEGAAKRLRARSFFITIFVEATIHKILDKLDLPITCNLFSAGGKFLMLAPNLDNVKDELEYLKSDIEDEIHKTFFNQFTFTLAWISSSGYRKLKEEKMYFGIHDFFKVADEMFYELEIHKLKKSETILINKKTGIWEVGRFRATNLYESYKGKDCNVCGRGPATHPDEEIEDKSLSSYSPEEREICFICYQDKFRIGKKLPKTQYIGFSKSKVSRDSIRIYDNYYVTLSEEIGKGDFYLLYKIGKSSLCDNSQGIILNRYIANHVPTKMKNRKEEIETFEDIAEYSLWKKKEDEEKVIGSNFIGILKADFDNLGLIFSKGFEDDEKKIGKTVSRYLTLSRMIDLFFSGWMKEIMRNNDKEELILRLNNLRDIDKELFKDYLKGKEIKLSKIYTVYSGGDDLVLVGPWETMIIFTIFLNMEFRRFTCCNDDITISAGLAVVKPKHPIAAGIREADELLKRSKMAGKNRITLFDTTVEWEVMPELVNFFLFLDNRLNNTNSNIKTVFLHRLIKYHEMAEEFLKKRNIDIRGLRYLPLLSYDIGRNIIERDKNGKIKKGQDDYNELQKLMILRFDEKDLIRTLKIPVFWALYRNRK